MKWEKEKERKDREREREKYVLAIFVQSVNQLRIEKKLENHRNKKYESFYLFLRAQMNLSCTNLLHL